MRLDSFLSTVGIVKRRTEAARAVRDGHVSVDGRSAKPAHEVRVGERIRVEDARGVTRWLVRAIPVGNVRKADHPRYAERLDGDGPDPAADRGAPRAGEG
jgi:ribosome-associated heat shock protein Hsp15